MRPAHLLLIAGLLPWLAGCYQAAKPMISVDEAVFPFTRLTYSPIDEEREYTLVRDGDAYVDPADETAPRVRFRQLGEHLYLVQGEFRVEEAKFYGLAVVEADLGSPEVALHAGFADKSGPPRNDLPKHGFAACDHIEEMICLEKLDPYLAYALARVEAGEAPDQTFEILSYE